MRIVVKAIYSKFIHDTVIVFSINYHLFTSFIDAL